MMLRAPLMPGALDPGACASLVAEDEELKESDAAL